MAGAGEAAVVGVEGASRLGLPAAWSTTGTARSRMSPLIFALRQRGHGIGLDAQSIGEYEPKRCERERERNASVRTPIQKKLAAGMSIEPDASIEAKRARPHPRHRAATATTAAPVVRLPHASANAQTNAACPDEKWEVITHCFNSARLQHKNLRGPTLRSIGSPHKFAPERGSLDTDTRGSLPMLSCRTGPDCSLAASAAASLLLLEPAITSPLWIPGQHRFAMY